MRDDCGARQPRSAAQLWAAWEVESIGGRAAFVLMSQSCRVLLFPNCCIYFPLTTWLFWPVAGGEGGNLNRSELVKAKLDASQMFNLAQRHHRCRVLNELRGRSYILIYLTLDSIRYYLVHAGWEISDKSHLVHLLFSAIVKQSFISTLSLSHLHGST